MQEGLDIQGKGLREFRFRRERVALSLKDDAFSRARRESDGLSSYSSINETVGVV